MKIIITVSTLMLLTLSACGNTIQGVQQDSSAMGKSISSFFSPSQTNVHAPDTNAESDKNDE